jgi:bifunctional pyridoxal-dependent enzyme with beta-cystathionase and maltose regulon repressor activities
MNTPTAIDVVAFLNARFAARGLPYRIENVEVLPYVNPMWMANWDVPQLEEVRDEIEEDLREARWQYPQVLPSG